MGTEAEAAIEAAARYITAHDCDGSCELLADWQDAYNRWKATT